MKKLNNKGFSLVELMVVVAIIGILSAIAIPSINKYMAKARQSEAKSNLASIYTANKALKAEYNVYYSHFDVIGYRPEGKFRYNIGFAGQTAATVLTGGGYTLAPPTTNYFTTRNFCTGNATLCQSLNAASTTIPTGATGATTPTATAFRAAASGVIGSTTLADVWTIDEVKDLRMRVDGTN